MWRNRQEKEVAWAGREGGNEKGRGETREEKKYTKTVLARQVCLFI